VRTCNLWLSDSLGYENQRPFVGAQYSAVHDAVLAPTIMGALPHAEQSRDSNLVSTPFFGQTSILYQQDGTQTTIDQVWELNQSNGANILQEYTAVPSGSQLSPYGNPSGAGSSRLSRSTDAGRRPNSFAMCGRPRHPNACRASDLFRRLGNLSSARKNAPLAARHLGSSQYRGLTNHSDPRSGYAVT